MPHDTASNIATSATNPPKPGGVSPGRSAASFDRSHRDRGTTMRESFIDEAAAALLPPECIAVI